jgi:Tfp pilus assembly protein PilF
MKSQFLALFILLPAVLFSQTSLNSAQISSPASTTLGGSRGAQAGQMLSLVGKVATEDNSAISEATSVVLECGNAERSRGSADGSGNFSLSINLIESEPGSSVMQSPPGSISSRDWNQCEVFAEASGYVSEHTRMLGASGFGVVQVGTVIMHPLTKAANSGSSIDVASLAAPEKAKKAFQKGQEQAKKGKWAAACDYFKRAVEVYPRYALAWMELGHSQLQQNDFSSAQQSFQKAAQENPHSLDAYVQIGDIAAQQRQWAELADATDHLVQLAPDASPKYWFLNSAANFNLGRIPQAESGAMRGLRMDSKHEIPQLEYLYGMILAHTGDYSSAILHLKTYLLLSPHATDSAAAQTKLTELEKLTDAQNTASR